MFAAMTLPAPEPRAVAETPAPGELPLWTHPGWSEAFPWLVQGSTARGSGERPFDLALLGAAPAGEVMARWEALARGTGMPRLVHGHQVHEAAVRFHREGPPGVHVSPATDGHATASCGVLLTVSTADCVPALVVDARTRAVAALHAGWRGAAAGILERGLEVLRERVAARMDDLHVHFGPAICGECYEVGPEVHAALGLDEPGGPAPVDLRAVLARRAVAAGVAAERVTVSAHCTRCGDSPFFSHRGGCRERQLGVIGVRCGG